MNGSRANYAIVATVVLSMAAGLFPPAVLPAGASESLDAATIREAAILQAAESQIIRSTVAHPVTMLYMVPEGQIVKKGDLLIELDDAVLLEELQEQDVRTTEAEVQWQAAAEALSAARQEAGGTFDLAGQALSLAKLALDVFIAGEYPLQVTQAENAVGLAGERENYARMRVRQMEASGDYASDQVALAQFELNEAKAELSTAQGGLQLLKEVLYTYRESELQLAIAEKEITLNRAQSELQRAVRDGEGMLKVARLRHEMESSRGERLKEQLTACKVWAPRAGMVLYAQQVRGRGSAAMPLEPGAVVRNRQPLVQLVDTKRFKLDVPVSLDVAQRVQPGRDVTVRFDALPRQTFQGRVTGTRVLPQVASPSAEAMITLMIDDANERLRVGMSAKVELTP